MSEDTNVLKGFENLLDRYDKDTAALSRKLYEENYDLRTKNKGPGDQVVALEKQLPTEVQEIVGKDDLELLAQYKEVGSPEELQKSLDDLKEVNERIEALSRQEKIAKVSAEYGFNAKVLATLANGTEIDLADDGVATIGGVQIDQYAADNWADFLPSLQTSEGTKFPKQTRLREKQITETPDEMDAVSEKYVSSQYSFPSSTGDS